MLGTDRGRMVASEVEVVLSPHGSQSHPQFRDHRAYRSRQVHALRPAAGADRLADRARDAGAGAGCHGPGARARHHHQGACRAHDVQGAGRRDVSAEPDRYAGARGFFATKFRGRWPRAKARCWWWMRRRAWRRRRWRMPTWRSSNGLEIIPVINKIDLPSADIERTQGDDREVGGAAGERCDCGEREDGRERGRDSGGGRARCCRRRRAIPRRRCRR